MNRAIMLCSIALTASLAAYGQAPSTPTKVGIINIQQAIVQTRDGQAAAKELDAKSAPKKKELEAMQAEIRGMQDKLSKMSNLGSEEQKQALMRDIDARTKQFNRSVEDAQTELDAEQQKVLNNLGGKMLAVLDKYAKDNGYAIIFDVSQQTSNVLFAANGIDVTKEVIELYDKNAAPATSAAPAPTTGGAAAKPSVPAPKAAPAK